MKLGIHGSVREGLSQALDEAKRAGAGVLQMLPYRRHHVPDAAELASFKERKAAARLETLVVHSRFVPSLASSDEKRRSRSIDLLALELGLAQSLGAELYILHAGAYSEGGSAEEGLKKTADSITGALRRTDFRGTVLIENVPGGGRRLCGSLEELARLRDFLGRSVESGVCLDTAHAWAAGYDVGSAEGALKFLARAHRLFGDGVRAFHLNDSGTLLGSRQEHHEHWGRGRIGKEGIAAILARPEYADAPAIVETPKTPGGDEANLAWLAKLRG